MNTTNQLTATQREEIIRLKQYFPFRICYGAIKDGEFIAGAVVTKHQPNRLARQGWHVEIAGR
jgi:hypothetical protein